MILAVYLIILVIHILMFVQAMRRKNLNFWVAHLALELICIVGSFWAMMVFNDLPGVGMMPGLTWISEFFYSLGAGIVYSIQFLISMIVFLKNIMKK